MWGRFSALRLILGHNSHSSLSEPVWRVFLENIYLEKIPKTPGISVFFILYYFLFRALCARRGRLFAVSVGWPTISLKVNFSLCDRMHIVQQLLPDFSLRAMIIIMSRWSRVTGGRNSRIALIRDIWGHDMFRVCDVDFTSFVVLFLGRRGENRCRGT